MRVAKLTDPAEIAAGLLNNARLDYAHGPNAQNGVPAIVANADPASGTSYTAASAPGATLSAGWTTFGGADLYDQGAMGQAPIGLAAMGGGEPWQASSTTYYATSTPGATWTLVTSAYRVDLFWITATGGALAHVTVDSVAYKGWDASQAGPQPFTIDLDGQQHTIVVTCLGDATISQDMLSTVADTTGTGLAACLGLTRNGKATQAVTWSVQATSASQVSVYNGGTLQGTLSAGSTSDSLIPGFTLALTAGSWASGNVAEVVTDAATLTISNVTLYSALATNASYTGPVLDSGRPDTEWPLLEFTAGPSTAALPTLSRGAGNTPVPDATWIWQTPTVVAWADPDGGAYRHVAAGTPGLVGRYSQTVAAYTGSALVWVSDIAVFWWQPTTDPFRRRLNPAVFFGPARTMPFVTMLAACAALQYQDALDESQGFAVLTATGAYLTALGQQWHMLRLPGEATAAYQQRLALAQQGLFEGGSQPWLQATLSGALGCPVAVSPMPRGAIGGITFPTTFPATFGQQATGYWRWQVVIPFAQLQIAPEAVAGVVAQVRPVGSVVSVLYQ